MHHSCHVILCAKFLTGNFVAGYLCLQNHDKAIFHHVLKTKDISKFGELLSRTAQNHTVYTCLYRCASETGSNVEQFSQIFISWLFLWHFNSQIYGVFMEVKLTHPLITDNDYDVCIICFTITYNLISSQSYQLTFLWFVKGQNSPSSPIRKTGKDGVQS